ncbi:MAG: NADH-quinone oxidoreductase subunit N [Candidatus Omnitrophica bacterium]|nr:NADH-quinone oxidoreductase subunit N [Candidatus Omnitrophota bacterium]
MSPDLQRILPEILLAAGGMVLLVLPVLRSARLLGLLTLLLLVGAADLKLLDFLRHTSGEAGLFSGMLVLDRFTFFFQMIILAAMGAVALSVMGFARQEVRARREFHALFLFSGVGLLLVVAAQNLALIYLGIELISVLSYLLVGFQKRESRAVEGGLKYFLFGALSTGAMLYGITLVYGLTGTMDLAALPILFPQEFAQAPLLGTAALLLIVVGLAFKLTLAPFHMWAPDAYEGAPAPVASFLSLAPKMAGFAVLVRALPLGILPDASHWAGLLAGLAAVSMTLGNLAALGQSNVKRMLAYSTIAHAGTMAVGLAVATPFGLAALLYYLVAYLLMNAGAFAAVIAVGNAEGREDVDAFAGLSRREPALAFMTTVCFLALAGVPPLAGFFAKMWIFGAALQSGAVGLAVIAAVNSVISLFYYVRVIKAMYLDPVPSRAAPIPPSTSLRLVLALCAAGLFIVGLWQGPWLDFASASLPLSLQSSALPWGAPAR